MTIEVGVSCSSCPDIVSEEFGTDVGLSQAHFMTAFTVAERDPIECFS
jgi:hypothetical protein